MKAIKKIKVYALARFQTILGVIIGLICGILYSIGGLLIDVLVSMGWASSLYWETPGLSYGTVLAFGALIGMPVIGAVAGFLLGIVEGILYNLFAKWFRGFNLDFERKEH